MLEFKLSEFCSGGCSQKLGAGFLSKILSEIPILASPHDKDLLVGYDTSDDAAALRINSDTVLVQTLDFFPPMVEDPYVFGKIAAANALSDVYAMGADVLTALNIVTFPEGGEPELLKQILRGGAEKIHEAGGVLAGGHSINDDGVKYGLSVLGSVHPDRIWANNTALPGDVLILTKPLGSGIITTAYSVGEASEAAFLEAIKFMQQLNKNASEASRKYPISACTDVTGFGLLGHLCEMINDGISAVVEARAIPIMRGALECAEGFITTSGGQRNRNSVGGRVSLGSLSYALQEIVFDPQTSGGLIVSVQKQHAQALMADMHFVGVEATVIGKMVDKREKDVIIQGF